MPVTRILSRQFGQGVPAADYNSRIIRVVNSHPERFNVMDYGATGNMEDDASAAVRATIAVIKENGIGTLYFPEGYNFKLTQDASNPYCAKIDFSRISFKGRGRIARATPNVDTFFFTGVGGGSINEIDISEVYLNPLVQSALTNAELNINSCQSFYLHRISFGRMHPRSTGSTVPADQETKMGILLKTSASGNGSIKQIRGFGIYQFANLQGGSDIFFEDCFVDSNRADSNMIYLKDINAISMLAVDWVNSKGVELADLSTITGDCMTMDGGVNFCEFTNSYFDTHKNGVRILGNCMDLNFTRCWFSTRPGTGLLAQSKVVNGSAVFPTEISICDSTFTQCGRESIRIEGGKGHIVHRNKCAKSGNNASGLSCIYVANTTALNIKDNLGYDDMFSSVIGGFAGGGTNNTADRAQKGIELINCPDYRASGNNFSAYATPLVNGTSSAHAGTD